MRFVLLFLLCCYVTADSIGVGDSIMGQLKVVLPLKVHAFSGSGLSNPRIHNWTKEKLDPLGPVVVSLGTNDAQGISPHRFGTPAWKSAYAVRVSGLMQQVKPGRMLWLLPARTGSTSLDGRLDIVRAVIVEQASIHKVVVLDMRVVLGEVQTHNKKVHSRDKIHLNMKGIRLVNVAVTEWVKGVT